MKTFDYPVTWKQVKDFIDDYVKDDDVINYIDIEPDKCLYLAITSEGQGVSIVNGNATCWTKPYEYSLIIRKLAYTINSDDFDKIINKPIDEIRLYLKIAEINPEKGKSEDNKLTGREVKKLWEMDFKSRQRILISKYLQ